MLAPFLFLVVRVKVLAEFDLAQPEACVRRSNHKRERSSIAPDLCGCELGRGIAVQSAELL